LKLWPDESKHDRNIRWGSREYGQPLSIQWDYLSQQNDWKKIHETNNVMNKKHTQ